MDNTEQRNQEIFDEAARLVDQARTQLDESTQALDSLGLDAGKVRSEIERQISAEQAAQAEAEFHQDMQDVQREVDEEMARRSFQNTRSAAPRPRRNMI